MRLGRPTPSFVISMVALGVSLGGTATAATMVISSSKQIRAGSVDASDVRNSSLTGVDVKNGSLKGADIKDGSITSADLESKLRQAASGRSASVVSAREAVRKAGPEDQSPGSHRVATLPALEPGTYLLLAKTTLTVAQSDQGLLDVLLRASKTANGRCTLGSGGDQDDARQTIASPGSQGPATLNLQLTRTIASPTDITLDCDVNDVRWRASDTSIVAVRLGESSRTDVTG